MSCFVSWNELRPCVEGGTRSECPACSRVISPTHPADVHGFIRSAISRTFAYNLWSSQHEKCPLLIFRSFNFACGTSAYAQSTWQPSGASSISLDRLVVAKVTTAADGVEQVSILKPTFQTETRSRMVTVQKCRDEERTRDIEDPTSGEISTQTYAVKVPYAEQVEQSYSICIRGNPERTDVRLDALSAWKVDGASVETNELKAILSTTKHVFLLAENANGNYVPDQYFSSVLDPEAIIVHVAKPAPTPASINATATIPVLSPSPVPTRAE